MNVAPLHNTTPEQIQAAARILREGGLVVFPTETVYGVAACATHPEGERRLRALKTRPDQKPFTLHLPDPESVGLYADLDNSPLLRRLVRKTMPGPITMVVDVDDATIARKLAALNLTPEQGQRLYHQNTIGLRCPDEPIAAAVLGAAGVPIVASSANPAGGAEATDAASAAAMLGDKVDLILDGGPTRYSKPSTVVRITGQQLQVLREGVFDRRYLDKLAQQVIVFVCSGNTCRSPMAQAIARDELARRLGVKAADLERSNVSVLSAGVHAMPGSPMTPEAVRALKSLHVWADDHVSRPLTLDLVRQADAVFCMTAAHRSAVLQLAPEAASKVVTLDPDGDDVSDPIGASLDVYVECARRIGDLVRRRLDELGFARTGAASRSE